MCVASQPTGVLIFYGHGGVGPEGMWGDMTHAETVTMYQERGLQVTHTADWPASLDAFRLVVLPAPGFRADDVFTPAETTALTALVQRGGVLLVEAENGNTISYDVINPLLVSLGAAMQMTGGFFGGDATVFAQDPLTAGLGKVGTLAGGRMEEGVDTCLAAIDDECVAGQHVIGTGSVVLVGDGNMFSDLANWDQGGFHNRRFLLNLAQLPP